jgi:GxxExxY protein
MSQVPPHRLLHSETTGKIIGAAFEVWKILGYGFLEKVYENALVDELGRRDLHVQQQVALDVQYKGVLVGQYVADILVDGKVVVEVKAEKEYNPIHEAQILNYLKATQMRVGLLMNFGQKKCQHKRLAM